MWNTITFVLQQPSFTWAFSQAFSPVLSQGLMFCPEVKYFTFWILQFLSSVLAVLRAVVTFCSSYHRVVSHRPVLTIIPVVDVSSLLSYLYSDCCWKDNSFFFLLMFNKSCKRNIFHLAEYFSSHPTGLTVPKKIGTEIGSHWARKTDLRRLKTL